MEFRIRTYFLRTKSGDGCSSRMPTWLPLAAPTLTDPASAEAFFRTAFVWEDKAGEMMFIAHTDQEGRCLHLARYPGANSSVAFPLKMVLTNAIEFRSKRLLMAHNHPSGDPTPSESDMRTTRLLATVAGGFDCRLVDHLIFADDKCTSFRVLGLL